MFIELLYYSLGLFHQLFPLLFGDIFFGTSGPINVILKGIGFSNPPSWLITPGYSLFACIVANIWVGLPFVTVMLLGGLQSLPGDIYEAADIDGQEQ